MAKHSLKGAQKSPKKCIFCDANANSEEHFWSQWMHTLLPQMDSPQHKRQRFDFHPKSGLVEKITKRQGHVHTIRIRTVCKNCNNGWMNQLEQLARPLLTPLIQGDPVALDHEQTSVIARWAALKCMVVEHTDQQGSITPRADKVAFRDSALIPPYFRIYLASHKCSSRVGSTRHTHCLSLNGTAPNPPLEGTTHNIQTLTFILGSVFIHINCARIADFELERSVLIPSLYRTSRIWPLDHYEMIWPRAPMFDCGTVRQISNTLDFFINAHRSRWIDPDGGPDILV
jgi:hypothetical protein